VREKRLPDSAGGTASPFSCHPILDAQSRYLSTVALRAPNLQNVGHRPGSAVLGPARQGAVRHGMAGFSKVQLTDVI
jgi:hypothetical protein